MSLYLDHAATTPLDERVLAEMMPYLTKAYGNASSIHSFGREARLAVEKARAQVAEAINAQPNEIYFTSGGTEADNWAIFGAVKANAQAKKGRHIITTAVEHHAVLHTCQALEKQGYEVTYLPVDGQGMISLPQLEAAIRPDTVLISVMYANNEIGTVMPVAEIGALARAKGVLFHTDAVQAVGHEPVDVVRQNIDLLSLSAHKFYGPKGVGALYVRKGVRIENLLYGGAQEKGRRPGTDNTPAIVGLGKAIELAVAEREAEQARLLPLRNALAQEILAAIPFTRLNGHPEKRLCNNVNVSLQFIEGEALLLSLDLAGIAASSGSACTSGSLDPSHVLLAIGLPHEIAHGSLRFTLGKSTKAEDIRTTVAALTRIAAYLRGMSPLYEDFLHNRATVPSCGKNPKGDCETCIRKK